MDQPTEALSSSGSTNFEEKRLKRLKECSETLQGYPALIHRPLMNASSESKEEISPNKMEHGSKQHHGKQEGLPTLRVMQFNILADALADTIPKNFNKSPKASLEWNKRKERIIQQILSLDPDVICLEEVDHFEDFFEPLFVNLGYKGFFFPKKESPCLKMEINNGPDGVALFYRTSRLDFVSLNKRYLENEEGKESNQPVIACMLCDKLCKRNVCVAVTHFKAKKGFENLRTVQAKDTIKAVQEIRNKTDPKSSIIICGDFNGEPCEDFYVVMNKHSEINLESAYKKAIKTEIEFTTWKIRDVEVKHTIDYIWFSPDSMDVLSYLAPPCEKDVPNERFPSFCSPSDHIALCCDFCFY